MSEIKYQGIIDLSVKNNSHTMAYEFVEKFADGKLLHVLEVGCSTGYFGSALKAAGHTVWGIEPNQASATLASQKLDYVFVGLVEDFIADFPDKRFDVISFGDVLEHIAEPSEVLKQCQNLLVEGGAIVASVPNVAHVTIRAMLLDGRWDYSDLGILDRTHLRFFTRESIQELFQDSQYTIVEINAVKLPADVAAKLSNMRLNEKALACVESFALDDRKYDFQYVLLAIQTGTKIGRGKQLLLEKPKVKVLALAFNIEHSHFHVRLGNPLHAWATSHHGDLMCKTVQQCDEESIAWADVLVVQRNLDMQVLQIVAKAAQLGKKIIFEIDDLLFDLPGFLSHHKAGLSGYLGLLKKILPMVNCVTVTTKRLGLQMEPFDRPVVIIPNCVESGELKPVNQSTWQNGVATLIVASTDAVLVDFILPAITQLTKRQDLAIKVLVIGPPGNAFEKAGVKCERAPNFNYDEFKVFIRNIENPIGIIPLDNSLFSSCKSAVKFFDYSLAGIPVICSNVPPYSDVIINGVTGLLVSNETEQWFNAIEQLVASVEDRKTIVTQAKLLVEKDYGIANAAEHWNVLLNKLKIGCFDNNPPIIPSEAKFAATRSNYLLAYLINPAIYKRVFRVIRRDGLRGVLNRVFPPSL